MAVPWVVHALCMCMFAVVVKSACHAYGGGCSPPCFRNERYFENCWRMPGMEGPKGCAFGELTKYCEFCDWGEYNAASNTEPTCQKCPANTIITQGRYSKEFNRKVGEWCEEDCGVALRNLIEYPIEHDKDFWGELYNPFRYDTKTNKGVPCVQYSSTSKLSDCTEKQLQIADNMIVVPSKKYTGNAWLDFRTEVDTSGILARKCQKCDVGKYISKDYSKPKYNQISCKACPDGMVSTNHDDSTALFLPADVLTLTIAHLGDITPPVANYHTFACRACSSGAGVPTQQKNVCVKCAENYYQVANKIEIKQGVFMMLGTACQACPAGYEYHNWVTSKLLQCRSKNGLEDCCRLCPPNSYSTGDGTQCVKIPETQGSAQPYGATSIMQCGIGEELVYCTAAGVCNSARAQKKIGWRTCRPCADDNTLRASATNGQCIACKAENLDIVEITHKNKCTECSTCHVLSVSENSLQVHLIKEELHKQVAKLAPTAEHSYTRDVVIGKCDPLQRRSVTSNTLADIDYYRERKDVRPVPDFYTLIRTTANCSLSRCADVCTAYFQYSPACGQQETNLQSIWVVYENTKLLYRTLTPKQQELKLLVEHGPCKLCQTCAKGSYNGMCDVHISGNDPVGSCLQCYTECADGFFLHHPDKEAGCHSPPVSLLAADGMWKINHNYECRPCPTWVRQDASISVVSACGARKLYTSWAWDDMSNLIAKQQPVSFSNSESDLRDLGSNYRNYRSFVRDLLPYCPPSYFYNEQIAGCNLLEPVNYKVPGTSARTVAIGYGAYNPACCQACTTCPYLMKKDTSNWKSCTGMSLTDTQNACVDRCGAMHFTNKTAGECRRCSTCAAGFL